MMKLATLVSPWRPWRIGTSVLALFLLSGARPALAKDLTFAVIDSPPFGIRQHNHAAAGLYPAILRAVSAESNMPIQMVLIPFARAASLVATGQVQGTLMFKTAGTDNRTVPLVALFETGLIVQARPGLSLRRRADLASRLIGRIRGGCHSLEADSSQRWRFHELNNQQQGVAMLAAGRIDVFCTTPEAFASAVDGVEGAAIIDVAQRITLSHEKVWLLVHPSVAADVRGRPVQAVARLKASGRLAEVFKQELGPLYPVRLAK